MLETQYHKIESIGKKLINTNMNRGMDINVYRDRKENYHSYPR